MVEGRLVDSLFVDGHEAAPGSYKFYSIGELESAGLHFVCPCGCGAILGVAFKNPPEFYGPVWEWDGNKEKPTVKPSIRHMGGCKWHGYLTDGIFQDAT